MQEIGQLRTISPREAWRHEELEFTPWLSENLAALGEVIGMALELENREVSVGNYFADIVASCPVDGSVVLIENQLEKADHGHLGQVMTYLAGTKAETVVWIATEFSDAHLSAVSWLNAHTVEPYAFFAVRLRVVRIGDSLPAPVFEVLEKPNNWERRIQAEQQERQARSGRADDREAFWARVLDAEPEFGARGLTVNRSSNQWLAVDRAPDLVLSIYLSMGGVGVFMRGRRGAKSSEIFARFSPRKSEFEALVGEDLAGASESAHPGTFIRLDMTDRANWDEGVTWLCRTSRLWLAAISQIFGESVP